MHVTYIVLLEHGNYLNMLLSIYCDTRSINHDDTRISMETPQNTVQDPALSETMETSINNKPVMPDYDDTVMFLK